MERTLQQWMGCGIMLFMIYRAAWLITESLGWSIVPVSDRIDIALFLIGTIGLMLSDLYAHFKRKLILKRQVPLDIWKD